MSQAVLALGLLIGLQVWLSLSASAGLVPESGFSGERQQDYGRALLLDSRERRAASSGLGPSFIRYGRNGEVPVEAVKQPHTRSDIIIRYGRDGDGLNSRLNRLRQERKRRLARLALICAAKIQEDLPANSAEEQILKEICKDAPLHPTVPDFV